ncbi:DUF3040 domain-containing protein [Pseudonocardia abyssalis]|jgi:hypothetical protein|uniref:DUF3040 domain-containing protein n=1 Tax=Pseudonocardia abyssalis TaxID=2792008 RepID=A0ABS6UKC8_9PSEU|nr:DUF3040 domain-containing protein [Pseudonocardia abyssalis]MBW0132700.1 DUF3040 domain-containing protein [Pseudonocardia abyssalis]
MPLSPREQKALAAIEQEFAQQDPDLAATFQGARARSRTVMPFWLPLSWTAVAALVPVLAVLVGVHALVAGLPPLLTGVLTVVLAGGWVVFAARTGASRTAPAPSPTGGSTDVRV